MRHRIVITTIVFLSLALLLAVLWCVWPGGPYEPFITTFALAASITGLVIDRWLSEKEKRGGLIYAIGFELTYNTWLTEHGSLRPVRTEGESIVVPRMLTSSLNSAIASGAFVAPGDRDLFTAMVNYRNACEQLNAFLDFSQVGIQVSLMTAILYRRDLDDPAAMEEAMSSIYEMIQNHESIAAVRRFRRELFRILGMSYSPNNATAEGAGGPEGAVP